jgi:hypothetical protein
MRPNTSNTFHASLAFLPSPLTARGSMRLGDGGVGSRWSGTTGSRYGTAGMEASSWVVVGQGLRSIPQGGNT